MRSAGLRHLGLNSASSLTQDIEHSVDALRSVALNLCQVYGFHQPWIGSQESRVEGTSGSRDHLPSGAVGGVGRDLSVYYSILDISHGLVAEWAFFSAPFETLNETWFEPV